MTAFVLPAVAVTAAALLARSGIDHLRHPHALRVDLGKQDLVPRSLRRPLPIALGLAESALSAAATAALVADRAVVPVGASVSVLGLLFLAFLLVLHRTRPGQPCGCVGAGHDGGVGRTDGLRAATVLAGGIALAMGAATEMASATATQRATTVVAGVALAAVIDGAARAVPASPPAAVLVRSRP